MTLSYEEERLQNIAENQDLLKSLGLDPVPEKRKPQPRPKPKRPSRALTDSSAYQRPEETDDEDEDKGYEQQPRYARRLRTKSMVAQLGVVPRSVCIYAKGNWQDWAACCKPGSDDDLQRKAQRLGKRTQNPKRFGHIPGVDIGTWWPSRMDCSTDAIHAPVVAGISGNAELGAWSVALSGGYVDDMDLGETFTYTGCGGRDLKGTKQNPKNLRTAPQTFDQSFEHSTNASLKTSSVTKKPVRVIRGFKLQSPFAPATGYGYDGLYIIERAWLAPGLTKGLKVYKFAFKRVQGQPPLPRNDEEGGEDGQEGEEEADESEAEATPGEEVEEAEDEEGEGEAESEDEEAEPAPTGRRTSSRKSNGAKPTPAPSRQFSSHSPKTSNGYHKARAPIAAEPEANSRRSSARHSVPQPVINGKRRRPSTSNDAPQPLRVNGRRTSARLSGAATPANDGEAEADGKAEVPEPATKRIMARRYRPRTEVEEEGEQDEPATRKRPRRSTNNEPAQPEEVEIEAPLSRSNGGEAAPSGKKEKAVALRRSRRSLA